MPRYLLSMVGLLAVVALVGGCTMFDTFFKGLPSDNDPSSSGVEPLWQMATAADGQAKKLARACTRDLTPQEAKQLAQEALQKAGDTQLLVNYLSSKGKNLKLDKALGCAVKGKKAKQGNLAIASTYNIAQATSGETEGTLIEIPAGDNAALYIAEIGTDSESWASVKNTAAGGDLMIHTETVASEDLTQLQVEEATWYIPNQESNAAYVNEMRQDVTQLIPAAAGQSTQAASKTESFTYIRFLQEASDPTLVWEEAEVIVDEAAAEFILFVPDQQSLAAPQNLWGSLDRSLQDTGISLVSRVKAIKRIQDNIEKWEVARDGSGALQVRSVARTNSYQGIFELCSYQYYGRIVRFKEVLCHGAWSRWYNKILADETAATHLASITSEDAYVITLAEDGLRNQDVMFAGIDDLNADSFLQGLSFNDQYKEVMAENLEFQARLAEAQAYLDECPGLGDRVPEWLDRLAEASSAGQFDQVYEQVMIEGFSEYVEALRIVTNGSTTSEQIKETLRAISEAQRSPVPGLESLQLYFQAEGFLDIYTEIQSIQEPLRARLLRYFAPYNYLKKLQEFVQDVSVGLFEGPQAAAAGLALQLLKTFGTDELTPTQLVNSLFDKWNAVHGDMTLLADDSLSRRAIAEEFLAFSQSLESVIVGSINNLPFEESLFANVVFASGEEFVRISSIWGFVNWGIADSIGDPPQPIGGVIAQERLSALIGTVNVAGHAIQQNNWVFDSFVSAEALQATALRLPDQEVTGNWWAASYHSNGNEPNNRPIFVLARGEDCADCFTSGELLNWINIGINYFGRNPEVVSTNSLSVLTLAFTKPGIDSEGGGFFSNRIFERLYQNLSSDPRIAGSNIPVIVSWVDSQGNIWWNCFGAQCDKVREDEIELVVCNQHGYSIINCNANEYDSNTGSPSDTDPAEPAVIGTPPKATPPALCTGVCII